MTAREAWITESARRRRLGGPREAWIFDAVRTPRATFRKGTTALAEVKPVDLVATLLRGLIERGLDPAGIDDLILGCSTQIGDQGANVAKTALLCAQLPDVPGQMVSRLCISGLEAVGLAAAKVISGQADLVLGGGVESMSRVPMMSDRGAWFSDPEVAKATRFVHMGVAADLIATLDGRSRSELDAVAAESHARALAAAASERAQKSVVAVRKASGDILVAKDDGPRATTVEKLGGLPPAFADLDAASLAVVQSRYPAVAKIEALHSVGSSPQMADGASLVVVATLEAGQALGLTPRARIASYVAHASEPVAMLTGVGAATRQALTRAGRELREVALFEHNESFAATQLRFLQELELDSEKVNVNGGALALGHPLGATGGMLVGTIVDELTQREQELGVVAMCAGAGLAAAMVIERPQPFAAA